MPSVLLAAATHREGGLHITPEADDIHGEVRRTQGHAINNKFLGDFSAEFYSEDQSIFKQYVADVGETDLQDKIFKAAQKTYGWVEDYMSTQLSKSMPGKEYDYFMALDEKKEKPTVSGNKTADMEFKAALALIPGKARVANKTGMEEMGWELK
jgi:hypothetical protein